ncbi:hypothetical protein EI94DRAFT_1699162 [Lactarius quietus]|nr:hypothetical protein EI94DRAFT_1699162 [Lactarius quietus]
MASGNSKSQWETVTKMAMASGKRQLGNSKMLLGLDYQQPKAGCTQTAVAVNIEWQGVTKRYPSTPLNTLMRVPGGDSRDKGIKCFTHALFGAVWDSDLQRGTLVAAIVSSDSLLLVVFRLAASVTLPGWDATSDIQILVGLVAPTLGVGVSGGFLVQRPSQWLGVFMCSVLPYVVFDVQPVSS